MNAHDLHVTADYLEEQGWDGNVVVYLRGIAYGFHENANYGVCLTDTAFARAIRVRGSMEGAIRGEAKAAALNPNWALLVTRYRDRDGVMIRSIPGSPDEIVFDRDFYLTPDSVVELRKLGDDEWRPFVTCRERAVRTY